MKDELISILSHELRTPLTSIHGSLRMLASSLLQAEPDTGNRLLKIAVDSTERLIRLIKDMLDVNCPLKKGEFKQGKFKQGKFNV